MGQLWSHTVHDDHVTAARGWARKSAEVAWRDRHVTTRQPRGSKSDLTRSGVHVLPPNRGSKRHNGPGRDFCHESLQQMPGLSPGATSARSAPEPRTSLSAAK